MDKINSVETGARIKNAREQMGLTQEKLAELLDITTSHLSKLERAENSPSIPLLVRIKNVLHVSADYLLGDGEYNFIDREITQREQKLHCTSLQTQQNIRSLLNVIDYLIEKDQEKIGRHIVGGL